MADNYLEKQMADFRAGKLSARKSPLMRRPSPLRQGEINLATRRVLVACSDFADTEALVRLFRSTGARVAFIASRDSNGTQLAQTSGSRFYPLLSPGLQPELPHEAAENIVADIRKNWHGLDLIAGNLSPLINLGSSSPQL